MIARFPPARDVDPAQRDSRVRRSAGLYLTWNRPEALR